MSLTASQVKNRAQAAFSLQDIHDDELRDIYEFSMPHRNTWQTGVERMDNVFDSTAINSTVRFANRLQSDMTPPLVRWFNLKVGPTTKIEIKRDAEDDDAAKEALHRKDLELELVSDVAWATLRAGGFVTSSHEVYQDLAAGQGHMYILPGDDNSPVRYIALPPQEMAVEEGKWGQVIGLHRRHNMKFGDIKDTWPKATFSATLSKKIDDAKASNNKTKTKIFGSMVEAPAGSKAKWIYYVVVAGEKILSQEYGYRPFASPRWSRLAGDARGRGPLHLAIQDIRTLNKAKEMLLMAAALALVGAYTVVDDGVVNSDNVSIIPGALIAVASNGGGFAGASIQPLETGRDFDISGLVLEDLRLSIKKALFDDQLPPELGAVRSPTEIMQRARELAQDSGAAFGRLMDEWITPVLQTTIDILTEKGLLTKTADLNELNFKIQVTSSLARVQDIVEIEAVIQWLELSTGFVGMEGALISAKIEEILTWLADKLGVPAEFVRSPKDRDDMQEMIAQIIAQSQMNQQGQGEAPAQQ